MLTLWLWICLTAAMAALGAGYFFSHLIIYIRTIPYEQTLEKEIVAGRIHAEAFEQLPKQEIWIASPFGYDLHAFWIPATNPNSRKAIIFVHGVTHSLIGSLKYVPIFQKRGYHALIYDHRRHGKSGGPTTTFGYMEKHDLNACVDWVQAKLGPHAFIGIHGESMGAATALQHAAIDKRAAFYIADCPYSDLTEQLAHRLREDYRLPKQPLLQLVNAFTRIRAKFWFGEVSPIRDLANVHTPVLFIHGEDDTFVPTRMSLAMYEAKPGSKQLYVVPNAKHAQSIIVAPDAYEEQVEQFLNCVETAQEWKQITTEQDTKDDIEQIDDKSHFPTTVQSLQ